ncbi:MAG: hypothetical protein R2867_27385 [Caldilineaceae bacterium]
MTGELVLNLFGNPVVTLDGVVVTGFQSSKVQALLYYSGRGAATAIALLLANLLWGDVAEAPRPP